MWHFFSPNVIYGENALDHFEIIPGEKCFIITDDVLVKLGILKILTNRLDQYGKKYEVCTDVKPDPHEDDVLIAKDKCVKYAPDIVIGLGGGSVLDTAKVVWALYEFPDIVMDEINVINPNLYKKEWRSILVGIPTTSGTGAETTNVSVISRFENDIWKKFFFLHPSTMPSEAIVDPAFVMKMPHDLTINTAFDALTHALEGLSSQFKNEFTYALGLKAIELVFKYLPIVNKDPDNFEARDNLHLAASMAGLSFGNSQAHLAHNLGHSWGSLYHVPHGRAVGIFLPYTTKFVLNNKDDNGETVKLFAKVAKQLGWANWGDEDEKAANNVIAKIIELQKEVSFPLSLTENGATTEQLEDGLETLVNLGFEDSTGVLSPRPATSDDFRRLYKYAFEGKEVDF